MNIATVRALWTVDGSVDPSDTLDDDALTAAYARSEAPMLRANFVASVDGAVSVDDYSAGLSGPADKRIFGILRKVCDALLVGAGTMRHENYGPVRLDEPRRAWRRANGLPDTPTLVVVSGSLRLDPTTAVFTEAPTRPIVLTTRSARAPEGLEAVADLLRVGDDEVDLRAGVTALRERGFAQILCEGGPHLLGALTAVRAVDELCLTVSPLLAGPGAGRIAGGTPYPGEAPLPMTLRHVLASDGMVFLRYHRR